MTDVCAECGASPVLIRPTHLAGLCAGCAPKVNTVGTPSEPQSAPITFEFTENP